MTLPHGGLGIAGGAPVELVIYGSSTACGRDEELGRPSILTDSGAPTTLIENHDSWVTYSGVLTASQSFSNLVFVPTLASSSPGRAGAYVNIANFISTSCH